MHSSVVLQGGCVEFLLPQSPAYARILTERTPPPPIPPPPPPKHSIQSSLKHTILVQAPEASMLCACQEDPAHEESKGFHLAKFARLKAIGAFRFRVKVEVF